MVPVAYSLSSNTWRADDSSPRWIKVSAPPLTLMASASTLTSPRHCSFLVTLAADSEELHPLSSREGLKSRFQRFLRDQTPSWCTVQQHPGQQFEKLPPPFLPDLILHTVSPSCLLQCQLESVPKWTFQELRHTSHH